MDLGNIGRVLLVAGLGLALLGGLLLLLSRIPFFNALGNLPATCASKDRASPASCRW